MKYRSRTEIIDSILHSIGSGCTKTHIMYKAYMSYNQLKEYLSLLEIRELIKFEPETQLYVITPKGMQFMQVYERISELVSPKEAAMMPKEQVADTPVVTHTFEY